MLQVIGHTKNDFRQDSPARSVKEKQSKVEGKKSVCLMRQARSPATPNCGALQKPC